MKPAPRILARAARAVVPFVALVAAPLAAGHPVIPGFERFHADDERPLQEAGRLLVSELSCTRCHAHEDGAFLLAPKGGPVLDGAGLRLQPGWIRAFLTDPQKTSPGTTMPDVLSGVPADQRADQIEALVHYLVSLKDGKLQRLAKYSVPATGGMLFERVGCAACHADPIGSKPEDARQSPGLHSLEGLSAKYSYPGLTTFLAAPLTHRPGGRMPDLHLEAQEAADVAAYLLNTAGIAENSERFPLRPFETDPALVADGAKLFRSAGCANCHDPSGEGPRLPAPPLADLVGKTGGCLDDAAAPGRPHYRLSAPQSAALRHILREPLTAMDSGDRVHLTIKTFNCYACHERCGIGGPPPDRQPFFTGDVTLGNEGRFPPHLTDVGRKLTTPALKNILAGRGGIRPYLHTRMPDFGRANVGHLVKDFPAADDLAGVAAVDLTKGDPEAGRTLMGTRGGVGCITCHGVQDRKGLAMEALSLAGAPARYQPGWFRENLINPTGLRPGTLMPGFWPDGVAGNRTILDGDTDRQIAAIWSFLAKGTALPPGYPDFEAGEFEIIPEERPVVQRTMMAASGPQTIAVGFPQGVHLAFDSERCRPALMWTGRFIDAYNTWFSRKDPAAVPLGDHVTPFPAAPVAVLAGSPAPHFRGYVLDDSGVPDFLYRLGALEVTDRFEPLENGFLRTLRIKGAGPVTIAPGASDGLVIKLLAPASPSITLRRDGASIVKISYTLQP